MSKYIKLEDAIKAYNQAVKKLVEYEMEEFELNDFTECQFDTTQIKLIARMITSLPTIEVSEDMVSRKDFEDVIRRMGERNCFTCGVYHEGKWTLMARNPEKVTAEELEENDRAVSLAEVCKIIQETYEVCPATWGRLRNLPSVVPRLDKEDLEDIYEHISESYVEGYMDGHAEGEWINQEQGAFYPVECSNCHKQPLLNEDEDYYYSKYCPYCGAKMKG